MDEVNVDIRIFDVENGIVKINEHCLLIPKLRDVIDFYPDPIPALCFIYYMCDPTSPYYNFEESIKETIILDAYPGDYTSEDEIIIEAIGNVKEFFKTPLQDFLIECKAELHRMIQYLKNNPISSGRDGDLTERFRIIKEAGKIAESYSSLEKQAKDQLKQRLRGNGEIGEY